MSQKLYYKQTLRLYWRFANRHKKHLIASLIGIPGHAAFYVASPLVLANIVSQLAAGNRDAAVYVKLIFILAGLQLIGVLLSNFQLKNLVKLQAKGAEDIENTLLENLQHKSYAFFTNNFAGSIVNDFTKFTAGYITVIDTLCAKLVEFASSFVFSLVVLAFYSPVLAITFGVLTVLFLGINARQTRKRAPLRRAANIASSKRTGQLSDIVSNIGIIKTFANERHEQRLFKQYTSEVAYTTLTSWCKALDNGRIILFSSSLLLVLCVIIAVNGVLHGTVAITLLVLVQAYVIRLTGDLFQMSNIVKNLEQGLSDAQPMTERMLENPEVMDAPNAKSIRIKVGSVEFKDVAFRYTEQSHQALFEHFNLSIKPGEKIGLVGHSGSGKTTLTKMLLRFMDIIEGQILLDGIDITTLKQTSVRQAIAYVPQEPLMFHRSIMDNIRYGKLDASDKEVYSVAKSAHASEFITKLPVGYDTLVGERGMKLSGGQRQRVAIARAMLKDAPIIVLDEATSALDSTSEKLIQDALWKLMKDRTAIVIAHRLSTVQKMDRIIVLGDGKIIEQGNHKELLVQNGVYSELWKHQSGGFLED